MKINNYILGLLLISNFAVSQTTVKDTASVKHSNPVFRIETGYSQSVLKGENTYPYYTIRLGGNAEFKLKNNFGIETGLNYNISKGNTSSYYVAPKDTAEYNYYNHTLNVPVRLTYTLPIFWKIKLFGYVGPNFNIGLSEPTALRANTTYYVTSGNYDAYTDKLSRINIQLGAGGGIQWKSYRIKSGYDWGILNVNKKSNSSSYKKGWVVSFEYEL